MRKHLPFEIMLEDPFFSNLKHTFRQNYKLIPLEAEKMTMKMIRKERSLMNI